MQAKRRRWWPWIKLTLAAAVLFFIGRRFAHDLSRDELYQNPIGVRWLLAAGLLYLAGLGMSGVYWWRLLTRMGHPTSLARALRAYYVSQLGKYLPGKAAALVMRVGMVHGAGVPARIGGMTTFYEVIVTMASGSLLAFVFGMAGHAGISWGLNQLVEPWKLLESGLVDRDMIPLLAVPLVCVTLVPVLPPVFNWLSRTVALPFRRLGTGPIPAVTWSALAEGLGITTLGWLGMGASLALAHQAVGGLELPRDPGSFALVTASLAVSYVAGFVVVIAPGGLGVRELLLSACLTSLLLHTTAAASEDTTRGQVILLVLLLRVVWTVAEVALAGCLYFLPMGAESGSPS